MLSKRVVCSATAFVWLVACGGNTTPGETDVGGVGDVSTPLSDTWNPSPDPDAVTPWGGDGDAEDEDVYVPLPGTFGAPCIENKECFSGLCIAHPEGGYLCTKVCDQTCPPGYLCKGTAPWRGDVMFICAPEISVLCQSCSPRLSWSAS